MTNLEIDQELDRKARARFGNQKIGGKPLYKTAKSKPPPSTIVKRMFARKNGKQYGFNSCNTDNFGKAASGAGDD